MVREEFGIAAGGYEARVVSEGATLRALTFRGRDLVAPFGVDEPRPAMRGALLAPWPNRTADGRYTFDGVTHQLELTEPETGNAAHGLAHSLPFHPTPTPEPAATAAHPTPTDPTSVATAAPAAHSAALDPAAGSDRVVLTGWIEAQEGYPWRVRLDVEFSVGVCGFRQRITATNESDRPAPFGMGVHPYLLAGPAAPGAVDDWELELPAHEVLLVSPDRLLPVARVAVDDPATATLRRSGGGLDFSGARLIGGTVLNHAFTALQPDADGRVVIRLTDPAHAAGSGSGSAGSGGGGRRGVEVGLGAGTPWVQLYSADHNPGPDRRHALAVEPMTCPPDALNSGTDLRILSPGASTSLEWTLRALDEP
ncbi:aldose 1-epimerase family protein [Herbiconiux sp. P15]|uniref:aldose 1-epimerase family protein n=1 Tax=Herbiconiux liukaitaii TaxID=3342799 RepID=UPI0035B7E37F